MRFLEIPPFPRQIDIPDLENFIRSRISQKVVMWPAQAIPLVGAMCHPNDATARDTQTEILRRWSDRSETGKPSIPPKLPRIQTDWLKVADIFHTYFDLIKGQHQKRRGGPSIGKAITLVAANAESWGTAEANLWKVWAAYKDVAHFVTAATLITAEVRAIAAKSPPRPEGLDSTQFIPFQMAWIMPDLVLAVAMEFERSSVDGLALGGQPVLDPETLWRIPAETNVVAVPPPGRKIRSEDLVILKNRRAGNRGKTVQTQPSVGGKK